MSDLLDPALLEKYRNEPFSSHEGKTHHPDGERITLAEALHAAIGTLHVAKYSPTTFNPEIIKELDEQDIATRMDTLREIDSYLRYYGTKEADESVKPINKAKIKNFLVDTYKWFKGEGDWGPYSRSAIAKTMDILELGSPEQGKYSSDIAASDSNDLPFRRP